MGERIHTDAELITELQELGKPRRSGLVSAAEKLAAREAADLVHQVATLRAALAAAAGDADRLAALEAFMAQMKEPRRG